MAESDPSALDDTDAFATTAIVAIERLLNTESAVKTFLQSGEPPPGLLSSTQFDAARLARVFRGWRTAHDRTIAMLSDLRDEVSTGRLLPEWEEKDAIVAAELAQRSLVNRLRRL